MPNTLVHFGVQGALGRGLWPRLDARWLYLGCLLPDLPWILRRAVVGLGLPLDAFDLRLYTMAQASLAGTLVLCAALAVLTRAPRLVLGVLSLNVLLHLLLDACEVKWGNGVHLFAPFSWRMTSFGLVAGEAWPVLGLSVAGAAIVAWELVRPARPDVGLRLGRGRLVLAASLLGLYFAAPLAVLHAIEASDSYSVGTLRNVASRPGRTVSFDRTRFDVTAEGGYVETWTGERLRAVGELPGADAVVSLRGTFLAADVLRVDGFTEHRVSRDWPSYGALLLLAGLWLRPSTKRAGNEARAERSIV